MKYPKNVGDQGRLERLMEEFIGQASKWWGTHHHFLQAWTTTSIYFIEIFGGNTLIVEANISKFLPGNYPQENINCESEWKILGYRDERVWPHLFPLTLDNLLNK